jgi:hypothetical protein
VYSSESKHNNTYPKNNERARCCRMRRGHDKMGCVDVGLDLSKMAYASI